MFDFKTLCVLATALLAACGPTSRDQGDDTGGGGDGGNRDSSSGDGCSDASKLVYVVDSNDKLSNFDPMTKTFTDLGDLSCPAGFLATPFSMSIDRDTNAWVLYSDGDLYKVNTTNLMCTATSWNTQLGLTQFGMGFSTETAGGTADTLFVAGGSGPTVPTSTLATLSTTNMTASSRGTVTGWPELTGTGNAELWGFFPSAGGARIEKLDKTTGAALQTFQLPTLAGEPMAWAFAAWGGDFWVFLMRGNDVQTTVYQVSGSNGQIKGMTSAPGRRIVGAGVSTCAPTVIL
ncbi:MAG: hypothetical protein H0T42_01455 [Deltaproteobacteria bacterium]|nr:hypothetical protein [Deltaproteobacteria bacterium]